MRVAMLCFCAALAAIASPSGIEAQAKSVTPFWDDTVGESPIYPVGAAVPVYRAVLDFIYVDRDTRPPIIVMHDSAEPHRSGPCPFDKCPEGRVWYYKSKIDAATLMS